MYKDYFGFIESPFSIVPSSRYLFLSSRHREAMGHLQAGLGEGGGFAMLTGEVGTGKTTVSKALLSSLNENVKAGLILNPTFSETDLLEAICDEFDVTYPDNASLKQLTKAIHQYLLDNHSKGIQTLLLIDEAQHLSTQVLEQLRLLTNLETDSQKLLKVLLVGQPELQAKLQTGELRQLAQRITGRYHLLPLSAKEIAQYIEFRVQRAGSQKPLFTSKAMKVVAQHTQGVPRLINLVCDKALLYAFYSGEKEVSGAQAEKACQDVMSFQAPLASNEPSSSSKPFSALFSALMLGLLAAGITYQFKGSIEQQVLTQLEPIPVVEAIEVAPEFDINQELVGFIESSASPIEAMQTLYHLWGVKASVLAADCSQNNAPFYCERRYGNLQSVLAEKRPVVLTLQGDNAAFFAVLYAAYGDKVELLNAEQRVVVSKQWLESHWNGEFESLWYSEIQDVLKKNSSGEEVKILDTLLASALDDTARETTIFDTQLEDRVKAFQAWQGLKADGVVGQNTLKILDKLTTEFAPTILTTDGIKTDGGLR